MNFLKTIIRDNKFTNPPLRSLLRVAICRFGLLKGLADRFRIYGICKLEIEGIPLTVYSEGDDFIANELFYNLGYESSEYKLIQALVVKSNYLVDVGANTGIFSIFAAKANDRLTVMSFEPHPGNFQRFQTNIELNGLQNVFPHEKALGEADGEIKFTVPNNLSISATSSANSSFTTNFHQIDFREIAIEQTTLDKMLLNFPISSTDVVKIDVEYYEVEVLKGAIDTLTNKRPLVLVEILQYESLIQQFPEMSGKIDKNHARDIFELLTNSGYFAYSITATGISYAPSIETAKNRNFLFAPKKLNRAEYTFKEIGQAGLD